MDIWSEVIGLAVKLIIAVAGVLVTTYVIPWLKEKKLYDTVKNAVQAAEKLARTDQIDGTTKKQYVINALDAHGITVDKYIELLIESAVEELDIFTGRG